MALTAKQAPFIEPYGLPESDFKAKGPTAEAVKRALAHLKFLEWKGDWDQHWNQTVNDASAEWKRKRGLIPPNSNDGSWGEKAHETMRTASYEKDGETLPAFDGYAQKLLQDEAKQTSASDEQELFQTAFTEFMQRCLDNASKLTYDNTIRPVDVPADPATGFTSDCSGIGIQAAFDAKIKTGLDVQDPANRKFSGDGNTDTEDDWPKVSAPFRVGDAAHYSSSRHVIWCIKAGDRNTAEWISFGEEPPKMRKLPGYREDDFLFVVRPAYLA